jgi:outer membrane protein assembly factor BamD (BamD/ComL family)
VNEALPAEPVVIEAPDGFIRRAREEYNAGRIAQALSVLDQFRQLYPSGADEAWWLYGQLLEANGPARDIKLALEYYRRLIREFPQSPRAPEAQRRIAYLERYYFNIQ